ncbi:hypothetical protein AKJ09_07609 [Labilithrix luteola]|uniref:Uncharacterized protein n=1 Tax=Labilithrix luteola TaxID=1391654 RepID=A0A0K1Q534_9BACT|nr:hypothetical protein [Labilithrix luteola]AKV00946.1 hypothetical protein AKJ09_07609 [Labilithrix luteola]
MFQAGFAKRASFAAAHVALVASLLWGCTPQIGDKCVLSTDCSSSGDRICDTSQPGGYCTTPSNCRPNLCPDKAACVLFAGSVPGCFVDDRDGPAGARTGRAFCMARCENDGDCRSGYVCASPTDPRWGGVIMDNDQTQLTCMVAPTFSIDVDAGDAEAPVCGLGTGSDAGIDASAPSITLEAGTVPPLFPDAGPDGG